MVWTFGCWLIVVGCWLLVVGCWFCEDRKALKNEWLFYRLNVLENSADFCFGSQEIERIFCLLIYSFPLKLASFIAEPK